MSALDEQDGVRVLKCFLMKQAEILLTSSVQHVKCRSFYLFFVSRASHLLLSGNIRTASWDSGFHRTQFGERLHVCSTNCSVTLKHFRETGIVDLLKNMKLKLVYFMLGSLKIRRKINLLTILNFNQLQENLIRQTTNENKAKLFVKCEKDKSGHFSHVPENEMYIVNLLF